MAREKVENIFNKNHILLVKRTNCNNPVTGCSFFTISNTLTSPDYYYSFKKRKEKKIKCESPLGFYYYKTEVEKKDYNNYYTITKFIVKLKNITYELSYYSKFGGTNIGSETRPWNLVPGDLGISDDMVKSLLDDIKKLIDQIKENKINTVSVKSSMNSSGFITKSLDDIKNTIFTDLFGDKNGIRHQTNEEKILSHGFDLKTSFRKPKED